jgi:hypothetical protein
MTLIDIQPKPKHPASLMLTLNFNGDDLSANRAGQLSDRQREHLRRERRSAVLFYAAALIFAPLLMAFFIWREGEILPLPLLGFIFVALEVILLVVMLTVWHRRSADLHSGRVATIGGYTELRYQMRGGQKLPVLRVDEHDFIVPRHKLESFKDGGYYQLYYLPTSRIILSAAPIEMG